MRELIINSKTVSSDKATYTYTFPIHPHFQKGDKLALDSLSMYYSWPSITSAYGNNKLSYRWIDGTTYNITLEDGFYTISDLNTRIHYEMIANKHYMLTAGGNYVYFLDLTENRVRYAVQLDASPLPSSADNVNSWTIPSGAGWSLPANSTYLQLIIPTTNSIKDIIGFEPGTYPSAQTPATSVYSRISDYTPQVTPVSTVVMTCSLLNNPHALPNTLLYSFAPNTTYGSQINVVPPTKTFIDISGGNASEISVTFLDQNFNKLPIKDSNVIILLTIASKEDLV